MSIGPFSVWSVTSIVSPVPATLVEFCGLVESQYASSPLSVKSGIASRSSAVGQAHR